MPVGPNDRLLEGIWNATVMDVETMRVVSQLYDCTEQLAAPDRRPLMRSAAGELGR